MKPPEASLGRLCARPAQAKLFRLTWLGLVLYANQPCLFAYFAWKRLSPSLFCADLILARTRAKTINFLASGWPDPALNFGCCRCGGGCGILLFGGPRKRREIFILPLDGADRGVAFGGCLLENGGHCCCARERSSFSKNCCGFWCSWWCSADIALHRIASEQAIALGTSFKNYIIVVYLPQQSLTRARAPSSSSMGSRSRYLASEICWLAGFSRL